MAIPCSRVAHTIHLYLEVFPLWFAVMRCGVIEERRIAGRVKLSCYFWFFVGFVWGFGGRM